MCTPTSSPARRHTLFRPCIDIHDGKVKQIVGGTLNTAAPDALRTNFVASHPPAHYTGLYRDNALAGGHVIMLGRGEGNVEAAREAVGAWRGGLQVGGGITDENCVEWIEAGASKVIVTSYLFPYAKFSLERLQKLASIVGKDKLVVDVSCRRRDNKWFVAMDKWQRITEMEVCKESLGLLSQYCSEFLIHAADVEGLCQGIDEDLVRRLGEWVTIPTTYAGGAKSIADLRTVDELSNGKVDLTYGSSLDIFGGSLVRFEELVAYNATAKKYAEVMSS